MQCNNWKITASLLRGKIDIKRQNFWHAHSYSNRDAMASVRNQNCSTWVANTTCVKTVEARRPEMKTYDWWSVVWRVGSLWKFQEMGMYAISVVSKFRYRHNSNVQIKLTVRSFLSLSNDNLFIVKLALWMISQDGIGGWKAVGQLVVTVYVRSPVKTWCRSISVYTLSGTQEADRKRSSWCCYWRRLLLIVRAEPSVWNIWS